MLVRVDTSILVLRGLRVVVFFVLVHLVDPTFMLVHPSNERRSEFPNHEDRNHKQADG